MCYFSLVFVFFTITVSTDGLPQNRGVCSVPSKSADKKFTIFDHNDEPVKGKRVPKEGYINLECANEYIFPDGTNTSISNCRPTSKGEWQPPIESCIHCGISRNVSLTGERSSAVLELFPWHVAVYSVPRKHLLICGGTLIAPNIVVSAAHCFYNEMQGIPATEPTDYDIVVGKYTRDYAKTDDHLQKKIAISEILFYNKSYNPRIGGYATDIALIVLKESVVISPHVLPACVFRAHKPVPFNPGSGVKGMLVGWGLNETDKVSEILKVMEVSFMDYDQCAQQVSSITPDKFCTETHQGPRPRLGDGGGGLVFKDPNTDFNYVRGIASASEILTEAAITLFTDISYYQDWIDKIIREKSDKMNTSV